MPRVITPTLWRRDPVQHNCHLPNEIVLREREREIFILFFITVKFQIRHPDEGEVEEVEWGACKFGVEEVEWGACKFEICWAGQ